MFGGNPLVGWGRWYWGHTGQRTGVGRPETGVGFGALVGDWVKVAGCWLLGCCWPGMALTVYLAGSVEWWFQQRSRGLGMGAYCWVAGGCVLGVAVMMAVLFVDSCTTVWFVVVVFVGLVGPLVRAKRTSLHFF